MEMLPQRTYIGPRADTEEIYAAHFRDQSENSIEGNVIAEETHNCYLRSEAGHAETEAAVARTFSQALNGPFQALINHPFINSTLN
jgi:hypothetical protein